MMNFSFMRYRLEFLRGLDHSQDGIDPEDLHDIEVFWLQYEWK